METKRAKDLFVHTNGICLHVLDFGGGGETLLLFHGLTANAHAFDGLIAAGLATSLHVMAVDLRGRGQSSQPGEDYSMAAHAQDIMGLVDALQLDRVLVGGHSFGAFLSLYLAAKHPTRFEKIVLMDAAASMHPNTREMLAPTLGRLGNTWPSFDAYLQAVKAAPYLAFWDDAMTSYYAADVQTHDGGAVTPIPQPGHMAQAVHGVLQEPWTAYLADVTQPAILLNGTEDYTMQAPLLPEENARETVAMMQQCRYVKVPGNHQTMLYGEGAKAMVSAIQDFLGGTSTGQANTSTQKTLQSNI